MARKIWMAATVIPSAARDPLRGDPSPSSRLGMTSLIDHRQKLVFAEHRDAERFRLFELRPGGLSRNDIRSLRRDRARRLAAFPLDEPMDLVARKTRQRPGDHDRFPRQCRPGRRGDELWSDAKAFHLLDTVAVRGN